MNYFGLTTTRLGATAVLSDFLNGEATWRMSVLVFKSIKSMVLVPATDTQALLPSSSMPPENGSMAPAGKETVAATGEPGRPSAIRILLSPAGSTMAREPLDATANWRAVNEPTPKFSGATLCAGLGGGQNCVPDVGVTVTVSMSNPVELTATITSWFSIGATF